ncbi:MAG TPA: hypothetical protein VFK76_10690 [Gaiellaceae bacterium]|nr:hypothetical protein [Gaiellaceae bacterium]
MNTRRQAFALAGVLTATVLTAAAAFAGISHRPTAQHQPTSTQVAQVAQVAPQSPARPSQWEDD